MIKKVREKLLKNVKKIKKWLKFGMMKNIGKQLKNKFLYCKKLIKF